MRAAFRGFLRTPEHEIPLSIKCTIKKHIRLFVRHTFGHLMHIRSVPTAKVRVIDQIPFFIRISLNTPSYGGTEIHVPAQACHAVSRTDLDASAVILQS